MKNLIATSIIFLVAALNFAACIKGDTGPQGPQGYTGTANMHSGTLFTQYWNYNSTYNDYTVSITYPDITQSVLDNGAVLHYYRTSGSTGWISAPNAYVYTGDDIGYSEFIDNADPGATDFKVVVIAPDKMQGHTAKQWQSLSLTQAQEMLSGTAK